MSAIILFTFLWVSNVLAAPNTVNFFKHIGINTDCPGNTTFAKSTDCTLRCDNLKNPPQDCKPLSYFGCTCKDGYIPLDTGRKPLVCLKVEDCPSNLTNTGCKGNTTFGSIPYFTKVCEFKNYEYMVDRTHFFGCVCKDGYIPMKFPLPSSCVKEEDCPPNPKVVYTGLRPNAPSSFQDFEAELQRLSLKYGFNGPYSSNVTNTSTNVATTKSPITKFEDLQTSIGEITTPIGVTTLTPATPKKTDGS